MDDRDQFPTETEGLSKVASSRIVRLRDGDAFDLRISPVRKRLGDSEVRMLAYNGSIPGPTLHVDQGSEITVRTANHGDIETTVHWHGLRLENGSDGVPEDTQAPIAIGGEYTCRVQFPDAGFYWYHPHLREDFAQEMGLYATVIVEPSDPAYWPAADRQLSITLDDVLIEDGRMAPFYRSGPTFTAMGRFGNVMLINGETRFQATAAVDEVVRLYLVNTANTRIFNVAVAGARMKLIGGDTDRARSVGSTRRDALRAARSGGVSGGRHVGQARRYAELAHVRPPSPQGSPEAGDRHQPRVPGVQADAAGHSRSGRGRNVHAG